MRHPGQVLTKAQLLERVWGFDAYTETNIVERGQRYAETFRRGAFARSIAERGTKIKLLKQHDREAMPLGVATLLREDAAGLYGERLPVRVQMRPFADQSRIAGPLMKSPTSVCEASIHCPWPVRSRWNNALNMASAKL